MIAVCKYLELSERILQNILLEAAKRGLKCGIKKYYFHFCF